MDPTPIPWHTPTPFPTPNATPSIQLDVGLNYDMAESVVGGYNYINQYGIVDNLMFAVLFIIVVGGIWTIIRRLQDL